MNTQEPLSPVSVLQVLSRLVNWSHRDVVVSDSTVARFLSDSESSGCQFRWCVWDPQFVTTPPQSPRSLLRDVEWPAIPRPEDAQTLALIGQLEQSQWWSPERILEYQLRQATLLVRHAAATAPFYLTRLAMVASAARPLTLDEFRRIPVLKRSDVQANGEHIVSRRLPAGHTPVTEVSTSGSTGAPIKVLATPPTGMMFRVLGLRFHLWHRRDSTLSNMSIRLVRSGQQKVSQGNGWVPCYPPGPSYRYCATLSLSELYEGFRQHEPHYLQGYPSIVEHLIRRTIDDGVKPQRLRDVRTFGGVLSDELRELARQEWGVPIADNYSALESGIIALQCPDSDNLHVQSENVLAEVIRDDGTPCQPGEVGRLLITVLNNFATPLIRYELGDLVELGQPCACGRGLLTLRRIVGREMHVFRLPDGSRVVPFVRSGQFNDIAPIRQFQIIQSSLTDIDVNLVAERALASEEEQAMREHLQRHLHAGFNYQFHEMDAIPRGATGKFEMLRSDVS